MQKHELHDWVAKMAQAVADQQRPEHDRPDLQHVLHPLKISESDFRLFCDWLEEVCCVFNVFRIFQHGGNENSPRTTIVLKDVVSVV
jgi:hypothetical protein